MGAKLTASSSSTPIRLSLRDATDFGTPPPAPPAVGTLPNSGVTTSAAITTTDVVLRIQVMLIDPTEELSDDPDQLLIDQLAASGTLREQLAARPADFYRGLALQPAAGEQVLIGRGAYDLIASLPYQASGINFSGTLSLRDLSNQGFNAQVPIAVTSTQPDPCVVMVEREVQRRHSHRTRSSGHTYAWFQFMMQTQTGTPLENVDAKLTVDVPEEHFLRLRISGSSIATGQVNWDNDYGWPNSTVVAIPEGRYCVCRADLDGYVGRNKFVKGTAGRGTNEAPTLVQIPLWTPADVRTAIAGKSIYLDSGHGIAYGHHSANSIRCEEWYVVDRALRAAQHSLEDDWGIPGSQIYQSRTAGLMLDQYLWQFDFGTPSSSPRRYTVRVNAAHAPAAGRRVDELVYVLGLSGYAVRDTFMNNNATVLDGIASRLRRPGYTADTFVWNGDELGVQVIDPAGTATFTVIYALPTDVFVFGGPTDRAIFLQLIETRLADETMAVCLRHNVEIGMHTVPVSWFDRDYIKERMVEHAMLDAAFDYDAVSPWIVGQPLPSTVPPQFRHAGNPEWHTLLLGWQPNARQRHWTALRPKFNGSDGIIVTLHLNADDQHHAARGTTTYYNPSLTLSRTWARIMEKYVDPLEGGIRPGEASNGIHGFDGHTFGDMQASDAFLEIDFYNSLTDADRADPAHDANSANPRWLLYALDDARERFGRSIAEAIVEGLCYTDDPTEMNGW